MARFEKRRKMHSMLYNRITVVLLVVVILLLGFSVFSVFQKRQEALDNAKAAELKVQTLSQEETKTQEEINTLNTDEGVEAALRNEYQVSKDGEGLVVVVNKDPQKISPVVSPPPPQTWWQKILSFFKEQ